MPEVLSYNRGVRRARDRGTVLKYLAFGCALVPLASAIGLLAVWFFRGGVEWMYTGWLIVVSVSLVAVLLGAILTVECFQTGMPQLDRRARIKRLSVCIVLLLSACPMLGLLIYLWFVVGGNVRIEVVNSSASSITLTGSLAGVPWSGYDGNLEPGRSVISTKSRPRDFKPGTFAFGTGVTTFTLTYPGFGYVPWSGYRVEWDGQKWVQTR